MTQKLNTGMNIVGNPNAQNGPKTGGQSLVEMAERNIAVVRNNCGLNGKICLFYNTSRRTGSSLVKPVKNREQKPKPSPDNKNSYQDMIEGLTRLGLP